MIQFTAPAATSALAALIVVPAIASAILLQETAGYYGHHRAAQTTAASSTVSTIVEAIETLPSLTKFNEALIKANLLDELRINSTDGDGPLFTVFMPINDAFDNTNNGALSSDLRAKLFDDKWIVHLREILLYHIHKGDSVSATEMVELDKLLMENGEFVSISTTTRDNDNVRLYFNTAQDVGYEYDTTTTGDVAAANSNNDGLFGYYYMIDQVLIPSFVTMRLLDVAHSLTSTFASLIVTAGLESTLNDANVALTVLAPSNKAFDDDDDTLAYLQSTNGLETLKQVILYHILPFLYTSSAFPEEQTEGSSSTQTITTLLQGSSIDIIRRDDITVLLVNGNDNAIITAPDNVANNGIVHVLSKVLIPPGVSIPTTTTTTTMTVVPPVTPTDPIVPTDPSMTTTTLVNVITDTSNLSSLAQAVVAADMVSVLSGPGPYTLFAPLDSAFDMFPTMRDYMSDSSAWILHLQQVLKFHVTNKMVITSDDLLKIMTNDDNELMIPMLNGENVLLTIMTTTSNDGNSDKNASSILLSPAVMGTATISSDVVELSAINGRAHVINRILLPSSIFTNMLEQATVSNAALGSLLEDPDLAKFVEYLKSKQGITFFAPSHAALSTMGELDVSMEEMFFYHAVAMVLPSNSISAGTTRTVRSVQGGDLTITKSSNGDLLVNGVAVVTGPDNLAVTGIVHVIDRVLTIPETSTTTTTTTTPGQPVPQPAKEPANQQQPATSTTTTATTSSASCSSNPQCAVLHLVGDCCPTVEGVNLECCVTRTTIEQESDVITTMMITSASCSNHAGCAGLGGDCCPTSDNVYLDCCDS